VSIAAITLCVASQRVFIFVVYFVIDSVRKLLDTPLYLSYSTHLKSFPYVHVKSEFVLSTHRNSRLRII
jgi:hypothetical protein